MTTKRHWTYFHGSWTWCKVISYVVALPEPYCIVGISIKTGTTQQREWNEHRYSFYIDHSTSAFSWKSENWMRCYCNMKQYKMPGYAFIFDACWWLCYLCVAQAAKYFIFCDSVCVLFLATSSSTLSFHPLSITFKLRRWCVCWAICVIIKCMAFCVRFFGFMQLVLHILHENSTKQATRTATLNTHYKYL